MKFLHFATEDCRGGAAKAAYYIHHLLLQRGHSSRMLVRDRFTFNDLSVTQVAPSSWRYRLQRLRRRIPGAQPHRQPARALFNYDDPTILDPAALLSVPPGEVDVVCLHWITGMLTVRDIRRIHDHYQRPMIWVMNDMQPITGGCHYSLGCDGYTRQCGRCPLLGEGRDNDDSRKVWLRKQALLSPLPIVFWNGSTGSAIKIARSSLFGQHRRIDLPAPVDSDAMRPLRRATAREVLRLPQDKRIIFLGATLMQDERKGMPLAIETLRALRELTRTGRVRGEDIHLAVAGRGVAALGPLLAFPFTDLGFLNDSVTLALAYQAANVFLCPSTDDEGPMMVAESMLCGTPVAMFRIGCAADLIVAGQTGQTAAVGDTIGLARALHTLLSGDDACMGAAARETAERAHAPARVMSAFETEVQALVEGRFVGQTGHLGEAWGRRP